MSVSDPKLSIRDLLADNWDNTNTVISEDPLINTGWFNHSWENRAQVTITAPDEEPLAGGATGYSGISAAGEGLKIMVGTMDVECWAHEKMYGSLAQGEYKQLAYDMSEEVKRIVDTNTLTTSDLEWVSWAGRRELVDTDADPVLYRYRCLVDYEYLLDTGSL